MRAILVVALLVSGCASGPAPNPQAILAMCPPAQDTDVPIPAPLTGKPTIDKVSSLQIRVEVAREKERAGRLAEQHRANACAAALEQEVSRKK